MNHEAVLAKLQNKCGCFADWVANQPPSYSIEVSHKGAKYRIVTGVSPYTKEAFDILLADWQKNKDLHYAIAILFIVAFFPVIANWEQKTFIDYDFEKSLAVLPEEMVAELILEGLLND
jgi:hypothetical protein